MTATLESQVQELAKASKAQDEGIANLTKSLDVLVKQLAKTPAAGQPTPYGVFGNPTPAIRTGEDPLTSRGFSYMKMIGLLTGAVQPEQAKVELDIHNRLNQALCSNNAGDYRYEYAGRGVTGMPTGRFLSPLATGYLNMDLVPRPFQKEMKALVRAGSDTADPEEMSWIRTKQLLGQGYNQKALSWLNEFSGGALVAPPEQGELIELLRNKEALVNAGARVVPIPPQGRMKYPRQTTPSSTYWVGENAAITESAVGTGEVTLQAKKLAVLIKAPNELIRFASPAAEALLRDDMTKSLALGLDLAGLEGAGGDTRPRGVLNFPNINTLNSSDSRANGDRLVGEDMYRMIAIVEESNAEFGAFIMRPKTLYKFYQLRADAVAQGDKSGPFLFSLVREATETLPATLAGYPVVKSTQVSQVRSKGTSKTLTYIVGGMWSELLIGMFGAIEFAATTMGDTSFVNDQTWVRGILSADIQARHEVAFSLMDNIDTTL